MSVLAATGFQLRICTNKTCKRQGSAQVAQFAKDLGLPSVEVQTCGCLGSCGSGPNMVLLALDGSAPLLLGHVGTPQRMADLLREVCGQQVDDRLLRATELRLAGNAAARDGDLQRAAVLYSQGLQAQPPSGAHLLLSNRSGVRLKAGDAEGALADANAAVECAPASFTTAAVRQVEALLRLQQYRAARECLLAAAQRHPPFGDSPDCQRCSAEVAAALQRAGEAPS